VVKLNLKVNGLDIFVTMLVQTLSLIGQQQKPRNLIVFLIRSDTRVTDYDFVHFYELVV